jgi:hypothetical protein
MLGRFALATLQLALNRFADEVGSVFSVLQHVVNSFSNAGSVLRRDYLTAAYGARTVNDRHKGSWLRSNCALNRGRQIIERGIEPFAADVRRSHLPMNVTLYLKRHCRANRPLPSDKSILADLSLKGLLSFFDILRPTNFRWFLFPRKTENVNKSNILFTSHHLSFPCLDNWQGRDRQESEWPLTGWGYAAGYAAIPQSGQPMMPGQQSAPVPWRPHLQASAAFHFLIEKSVPPTIPPLAQCVIMCKIHIISMISKTEKSEK